MVSAMAPSLIVSLLLLLLLLPRALPAVARSVPRSVALQAAFLEDAAGSGDADDSPAPSSPSLPPPRTPAPGPRPTSAGPRPPASLLDGIVDFFRQYVMLIAVVGSLAFLAMFVVCAAVITRQRHKASAYYPSSFPQKKYVDQSDRAGGAQAFSEVPERAPHGRPEDALDSSQQLQADILAATQNLRSPSRAAASGADGPGTAEGKALEEGPGSREAPQGGGPAEKPEVPGQPCPAGASEGPGEPEAAASGFQEAGDPAGVPESPCACGSATPGV